MNVIDICPVGALTSKDHRFKGPYLGNEQDGIYFCRRREGFQL